MKFPQPMKFSYMDLHADTITRAMGENASLQKNNLHIDFERLAMLDKPIVQVFAVFVATEYLKNPFAYANSAIDFFERELAKSDTLKLALTFDDVARNANANKSSAILALEGGEPLEGRLENLAHFARRGVRIITLTWNRENELGYGVGASPNSTCEAMGLKPFGVEVVKEMNARGMIIDVSHLNEAGFWDVHKHSTRAFIASHSNAFSVTAHKRNLRDSQIKAIMEKGGLVGINLYPSFLCNGEPTRLRGDSELMFCGNRKAPTSQSAKRGEAAASMEDILAHIEHLSKLGAGKGIALGTDFDGVPVLPSGISDVTSLKFLESCITERLGEDIARAVMAGNFYEFLQSHFSMT